MLIEIGVLSEFLHISHLFQSILFHTQFVKMCKYNHLGLVLLFIHVSKESLASMNFIIKLIQSASPYAILQICICNASIVTISISTRLPPARNALGVKIINLGLCAHTVPKLFLHVFQRTSIETTGLRVLCWVVVVCM